LIVGLKYQWQAAAPPRYLFPVVENSQKKRNT
jgi:hypothetical protein